MSGPRYAKSDAVHIAYDAMGEELIDLFPAGRPEPERIAPIAARYGLEIDTSTIPSLCREHGLTFGERP